MKTLISVLIVISLLAITLFTTSAGSSSLVGFDLKSGIEEFADLELENDHIIFGITSFAYSAHTFGEALSNGSGSIYFYKYDTSSSAGSGGSYSRIYNLNGDVIGHMSNSVTIPSSDSLSDLLTYIPASFNLFWQLCKSVFYIAYGVLDDAVVIISNFHTLFTSFFEFST